MTWWPYPRYWHGYRVLVDPWLTYLPIYPLRYLMLAAMIAGLTWLAFELRFLVGADGALALIVPTVVLSDLWVCWIYAVHAIPIAFIFAGSAFIARKARQPDRDLILIAALLGSLFNYIDFLHNVPWQPMLIAFVALAAGRRGPEALRHRRGVVRRIFPDICIEMGDCLRSGSEVERYLRSDPLSPERRCAVVLFSHHFLASFGESAFLSFPPKRSP